MSSNIRIEKQCEFCGVSFTAKTIYTRYCSHTCNRKDYKKKAREEKMKDALTNKSVDSVDQLKLLNTKDFLSVQETCQLLGISRMSLHRYIKSGSIKPLRIGKRVIIARQVIDGLIQL